ncbi:MAG: DEAD/DEAH box helicase [Thermoplasmatota archaeon]
MGTIRQIQDRLPDEAVAALLAPPVRAWFFQQFPGFTPPQAYAVAALTGRENVLISSPTGSGKTLSAFLGALNDLAQMAATGDLEDRTYVLYVSPLKALNNDIARNLEEPLAGIAAEYRKAGADPPRIRIAVRTGDTPQKDRAAQSRRPPHILVTTPESLAILLCAPRFRQHLSHVRWVIVDEVHALAESKRGTHLALSLERLASLAQATRGEEPVRVGLSATIYPLTDAAHFLFGDRDGAIVDVAPPKDFDIQVLAPMQSGMDRDESQSALYRLLDGLIESHRTTLIFTNTRSGAERVVLHLKQRFPGKYAATPEAAAAAGGTNGQGGLDPTSIVGGPGEDASAVRIVQVEPKRADSIAAHHGSMSREVRLDVEQRLKRGELRCVVTSTSLELGIDIGYVDLVVLLGSPKGVARALQRIGRSGHRLSATSKGRIIAMHRDELVESVVLAQMARERRLDGIHIPTNCLDVLCQHLLGLALEGGWTADAAFAMCRRAMPYVALEREDFDKSLAYLSGVYEDLARKNVYGKVWVHPESGEIQSRGRMARPIYYLNIGTIPETDRARVYEGERYVGEIEEDFLETLLPGDVFTLGGTTWAFQHARGMKAHVAAAPSQRPTVPQWYSDALPLSYELAQGVASLRREVAERAREGGVAAAETWLRKSHRIDDSIARTIVGYIVQQARFAQVPAVDEVLVEEFVDDDLRRNYVFHTPVGRRANEVLARAFAHAVGETRGAPCRLVVNDYGFVLQIPRRVVLGVNDLKGLFFLDVRKMLPRALPNTEILKRRFRHVAARGLLVLRNYPGRNQSVGRLQVNSFVLYHMLKKIDPNFPILKEVRREILDDAFDVARAEDLCYRMLTRRTKLTILRGRKTPSPFAFSIVLAAHADAALPDDREALLRELQERVQEALEELDAEEAAPDATVP